MTKLARFTLATVLLALAFGALPFTPGPTPSTGALDNTFAQGGVQYTNFAGPISGMVGVTGMALQPDGKVVVVGNGISQTGSATLVARFNANGTLDPTFNSTGFVTTLPGLPTLNAVAIQGDGKIVVAGIGAGPHVALARLNANGSVDTTFNGTGGVTTAVGTSSAAFAVAIQADGKIVAAGHASMGSTDFALVRYNADGTLDTSFSGDGIATTPIGAGNDIAYAVAIQADGKIVAAGSAVMATEDFAVARFNTNGTLDATFNGTGFAVQDFGSGADSIRAVRIAPDGKVVVAGSALVATAVDFAVARYNTNGTPDATFNGTGRVAHAFLDAAPASADGASALAVLADGRIVAAGYYSSGTSFVAMIRLTAAGALDTTFAGGTGKFNLGPVAPAAFNAVSVQPDGKLVAAGYSGTGRDFLVVRTDAAGILDTSFGAGGSASLPASLLPDAAHAVAIQADGKIVAAGSATRVSFSPHPLAIARYTTGGTLDGGFGTSGRATNDVSMVFPNSTAHAYGVAIQGDGRVVVAGDWGYQPTGTGARPVRNFVLSRYSAAGVAEATLQTTLDDFSIAFAVRVQGDGKILAAGWTFNPAFFGGPAATARRFGVVRYNSDLTLDAGFNGTGKVTTNIGVGDAEAYAMAIQADGRILVAGYARNATNRDFVVVRYTAAGVSEGAFLTDVATGVDDTANAIAVQADGKILLGGQSGTNLALLRFTSPGVLDATFANGGKFLFPGAPIVSVVSQADGKVLALTRDFQVWRLTAAGVPDTTFGVAGRVALAMGPGSTATAMAVQADGRIVVVGNADGGLGQDFVVARINPAAALTIRPAAGSYDFGGQSMNTTHPSQDITITNQLGIPVQVTAATASAGFAVASNGCGLVPGSSPCNVGSTFTPTAEGTVNGTLLVEYLPRPGAIAITLTGTGERALVTHYYRSILGREPDSGGKAFWDAEAARVQALGANVNEVWFAMAQAFYGSPEYAAFNRDNTGFVTDLYNTFFNRAPDGGGLAFWKDQLDQGLPREVALAAFMFSAEFRGFAQAIFGTPVVRAEVDAVTDFYRGLLARLPDSGGFNFWIARFRAAQCSGPAAVTNEVEAISSAFATSGEYAARGRSNAQYVGDLYNAFLRRGGDLPGVQFWINQVTTNAQTREEVRVQFKNSPEFQQRVNAIIQQGCLQGS